MGHWNRFWDGLQIPASSLLSRGMSRTKMGLPVHVVSMNPVQSSVLPGADTVEAGVTEFGRDQRLGRRGTLG